jgi:hypothetical protein
MDRAQKEHMWSLESLGSLYFLGNLGSPGIDLCVFPLHYGMYNGNAKCDAC